MSGIFGIVDLNQKDNLGPMMESMAAVMSHFEWFRTDHFVEKDQGIALGRVGIGIFNQAPQPVWNEEKTTGLVMAGEFYNRPADVENDEQYILKRYEEIGEKCVEDFDGPFVLAIWDRRQQRLIIANDRAGLYPLYYAFFQGKLIFAPEMKGVLCHPDFQKKLDLRALAEYVRFQILLGDKTFFEDLKILPYASALTLDFSTRRLSIRQYWDFSRLSQPPATFTFEEAVEEAGRLLKLAVEKMTRGNRRLGLYLSGGLDARVILGLIHRDRFPIPTVTYGPKNSRDVVYASRLAKAAGSQHHYFELPDGCWVQDYVDQHLELTEGFHSWIHMHGISVAAQARALMDVNLTGFRGATLDWEESELYYAKDDLAFAAHLFYLLNQKTTWPSLTEAEEVLIYASPIAKQMRGLALDSFQEELNRQTHLNYAQRAIHFSFSSDQRMYQYYTVFNRAYIEQRFPFCDRNYLAFVRSLPPEMHFERKLRRAVVHRLMPSLARIPYDKDDLPITGTRTGLLAVKLVQNCKRFVNQNLTRIFPEYTTLYADYESWLRGDLRQWGEALLLGDKTLQRGIFNPAFLESLWQRQLSGLEVNIIGKIAPLMTYEMMLRRFLD